MAKLTTPPDAGQSLGEIAYGEIRLWIISGHLPAGGSVSEPELAAALGIGKTPVRAALARLTQDGLVSPVARQGWRISPITLADVLDIFERRHDLETSAARLAVQRGVDPKRLARLNDACKAGYSPGHASSQRSFLAADRAFHLAIAEAAGSPRLLRMLTGLMDESERALLLGLALRARGEGLTRDRQDVVDAFANGDVEAATRLLVALVDEARDLVIGALMASPTVLSAEISQPPARKGG